MITILSKKMNNAKIKKLDELLGVESKLEKKKSIKLLESLSEILEKSIVNDSDNTAKLGLQLEDLKSIKNALDSEIVILKTVNTSIVDLAPILKDVIESQSDCASTLKYINESINKIEIPTEIEVKNFPTETKVSNFPKTVEISNLRKEISVTNFPTETKISNFPKEIKVSNQQEEIKVSNFPKELKVQKPAWFKALSIQALVSGFKTMFESFFTPLTDRILKNAYLVNIDKYKKEDEALAVKLVDKDGKLIKELIPHITVSPGGGGGPSEVGLLDNAGSKINPATEDNQTNGDQKTQIVDDSGNVISSHISADGDYHLGVAVEQNVIADPGNSSTANLVAANSYTFTGATTSTLGVVGLQWSLKTDQNATVYIEQSPDEINWDITDSYDYFYSKGGDGGTVQAVNSYWRIRVVLTGTTDTTYFRLQGVLCPIASPLPKSLDADGRLKTASCLLDCETGIKGKITPFGLQKTTNAIRIVGTSFSGTVKDTNFWSETALTGSITQDGEITLSTGVTANSIVRYTSKRKARHVAGTSNEFKFSGRLVTEPQANNIRRCGPTDKTDGFFFQVNGTTFGVGSLKGGVETVVNSGSFNGNYGSSLDMSTDFGNFVIWYWERAAYFFVNGVLLHTIIATSESLTNTCTLPITMENYNTNGNTTDNSFRILTATISRLGSLITNPQYYYAGTNATTILKYGAGTLQRVVITDNVGTMIVYDNTAASGSVIANIDASKTVGTMNFDVSFSLGLTIVTASTPKMTVVYE